MKFLKGFKTMTVELKYVIANVSDLAAAAAFWRDTVGLKLKFETPEWAEFDTGPTRLALQPASPTNPAGTWQPGLRVPDLPKLGEPTPLRLMMMAVAWALELGRTRPRT